MGLVDFLNTPCFYLSDTHQAAMGKLSNRLQKQFMLNMLLIEINYLLGVR